MANEIDLYQDLEDIENRIKETTDKAEMNDLEMEKQRIIAEIKEKYPDLMLGKD